MSLPVFYVFPDYQASHREVKKTAIHEGIALPTFTKLFQFLDKSTFLVAPDTIHEFPPSLHQVM